MRTLLETLLCATVVACGGSRERDPQAPPPARPVTGIDVPPGSTLQQAIDAAPAGATLLLQAGEYRGPFVIEKPLHVWGPPTAVLNAVDGSTLSVKADHVTLAGFTVAGSGQRFDLMDGGVHLQGDDLTIEGVVVRDTLFGILVERCNRATVRGNTVIGTGLPAMGLRGDGIRLWETNDSEVVGNTVRDSRDVVVWYSSRNHLADNTVTGSRYGTHFMYSHDNVCEHSRYVGDEVGIFVMYSHGIVLRRNLLARSGGAAGIGIGLKESGDIAVEDSWLLDNTTGLYIDSAPLDPDHHNHYLRNVLRFCETAVAMHASAKRSEFKDNQFGDNGAVVKVGGQGDALACEFVGNWYDTYQGYDLDGDGRGDVPFEFRRLSTQIEARYPELAILHGAPAMGMVDLVGEVLPLFAPRRLMQDPAPRLRPTAMAFSPEVDRAR
ncbi:MAG TPA: nitrous oxide reductase family maturation protein NosD [Planctomycetota bacterium]|nr:nitrous oxide reductase family maturation protein NosD [Planctomycetota bacterium]